MDQTHQVLDYAPPPKRARFRPVEMAFALFICASCGASVGVTASKFMFPPMYASVGCIKLNAPVNRVPVLPRQWQLNSIVAAALNSTRQAFPFGHVLPASPADALSHTILFALPHTNLVPVMYTSRDPVVAQYMATAMLDLCLATPATDSSGANLAAQRKFAPVYSPQPLPSKAPWLCGSTGALLGLGVCLILMRSGREWPHGWYRPNNR